MLHHRKYDPTIPLIFITGNEQILDEQFRKSIPKSTISDWRNSSLESYYGNEYRILYGEAFDRELLLQQYRTLKKTVNGIIRIWISMSSVLIPLLHKDKKHSAWLVDHTQQLIKLIPKKTALRSMGFSSQALQYRINSLIACTGSSIGRCNKRNSRQLSSLETKVIQELFVNKELACWPMISLYYHGLREGILSIGLSTFYKYAKLLNLARKPEKPDKRPEGIKTSAPNQYLHIDTTYYNIPETGQKAAIVFASDNFSGYITGYHVAERNSSIHIAHVLQQTIETIHRFHPNHQCLTKLVADGGSENHATTVVELIANNKRPPIQKLIAKKDIEFSNSPIEAINKICKRYLRHHKPQTLQHLILVIELFVNDYNTIRPHGKLKGLTPLQAYQGQQPHDFHSQIMLAREKRIATNKAMKCGMEC